MVRQVLDIVYKEIKGLHRAAYILALFAFGSQLLALLRDRLLAHQFGAGSELDIYYAAFRVPDLLFVLFASSLSVYVLIPFVTKARERNGDTAGSQLLSEVFTLFLVFYAIFAGLCWLGAPYYLPLLFPGIEDVDSLVLVARILLLQPLFLGLSSLFGVVTQLSHRFVLYAISPLFYNLGIIFGLVTLYPMFGLAGLAAGVVIGAVGHWFIQWPLVRSSKLRIHLRFNFDWSELRSVLALSVPRALTLSMQQLVMLALYGLASTMAIGSVAVFQLAFNLQSVPLAVIGASYSVAAFPVLAELYAKKDHDRFASQIINALRHIIFWSIPAIALLIVLRAQVVRVILGSGSFDWSDTRLTAAVLALLSLSLLAQAINLVVIRAFYAGGRTGIPFYVTLGSSIGAVVLAYVFHLIYLAEPALQSTITIFLRLDGVMGAEILSIAFGYAVAVIAQSLFLLLLLGRTFNIPLWWTWSSLLYSFSAATVGGLASYATLNFVVSGIDQERLLGVFIQGLLAGVVGIVFTILTYAWFKSPELKEIAHAFQRRLIKSDVVAPPEEVI